MPDCGSQIILCNLPIRFDTYKGCSHLCRYCFSQRKTNLNEIKVNETEASLKSFIEGKRTQVTNWCDWNIPLHWGGLSDPFQPAELKHRVSYKCLKLLAKTKYPFVVSTKGKAIIKPEYLELLKECTCVVQISAVCSKYDKMELGASTFEERIKMMNILSKIVKRVIVRIQPYLSEVFDDVISNIPKFKAAGVYGITIEGMKFAKKKSGLVKVGADFCYPKNILQKDFNKIKREAHKNGLKFYSAENRLRTMSDDTTCCGVDGLEGFKVNEYNICNLINGKRVYPTEGMKQKDTAQCFKALDQSCAGCRNLKGKSLNEIMLRYYVEKQKYFNEVFGK